LLSPDLLPQLFSSLGLSEHAAAGVCSTWSGAYSRQLRRCRYIDPRRVRELAEVPKNPNGLCMLPGGVLAITSNGPDSISTAVHFVAARNDSDPQALAACRASSLAARRFEWPMGLALTNDGLLVYDIDASTALYKFAKDGSMDELATVPALADYDGGIMRCAVHQQTQRTYAIAVDNDGLRFAVVLLDANLQTIATVEAVDITPAGCSPICDIAVHGDQVIVLTSGSHAEGSGLRVLDLDGRFLRTIAALQFRTPQCFTVSQGRAFVVDDDDDGGNDPNSGTFVEPGKVLHVIDIQSGYILQSVSIDLEENFSAILADGDEIYITCFNASKVVVLRYAGSEA